MSTNHCRTVFQIPVRSRRRMGFGTMLVTLDEEEHQFQGWGRIQYCGPEEVSGTTPGGEASLSLGVHRHGWTPP